MDAPPPPPPPALRVAGTADAASPRWLAPTAPLRVVKRFKLVAPYAAGGHRGIDLASSAGAPVRSPCTGVVSFAGTVAGSPSMVTVRCGALRATLQRVEPRVETGDAAAAGAVVGRATDARIDLSARSADGGYLDPSTLLASEGRAPAPVVVPTRPAPVRPGPPARVSEVVSPGTVGVAEASGSASIELGFGGTVIGVAGILLSVVTTARRRARQRSNITEARATIA